MNDTCGGCRDSDMILESYIIHDGDGAYRRVWKHKCRNEDNCEAFKQYKEFKMNHVCHGCTDKDTYIEQQFVINPGHIGYPSDRWAYHCRKESTCERFQRAKEGFDVADSWAYAEKVSKELDKEKDNVNHPSHYADGCSLECIDVMEAVFGPEVVFDYAIVNAFKYLWRYKNKNGQEDIRKAEWYLNKAHELDTKEDFVGSRRDKYWTVQELYFKVRDKERGKEDGEVQ